MKPVPMTREDLAREREAALTMLRDPSHPHHATALRFRESYRTGDEHMRRFIRAMAPYLFDADGNFIEP